ARKELNPQIRQQLVHRRLVRGHPLAPQLVRLTADLGIPGAAADAIPGFEHDDVSARSDQFRGSGEPRDPTSDNDDLCLDRALFPGIRAEHQRRRVGQTEPGLGGSVREAMKHTARGYWLEEAGDPPPLPSAEGELNCDVLVAGGGYTGMWTAWRISQLAPG